MGSTENLEASMIPARDSQHPIFIPSGPSTAAQNLLGFLVEVSNGLVERITYSPWKYPSKERIFCSKMLDSITKKRKDWEVLRQVSAERSSISNVTLQQRSTLVGRIS